MLISIDDREQAYLKILTDEIFGENNFITSFVWKKKTAAIVPKKINIQHEYILAYCMSGQKYITNKIQSYEKKKFPESDEFGKYKRKNLSQKGLEWNSGQSYGVLIKDNKIIDVTDYEEIIELRNKGKLKYYDEESKSGYIVPSYDEIIEIKNRNRSVKITNISIWRWSLDKFKKAIKINKGEDEIIFKNGKIHTKEYENQLQWPTSLLTVGRIFGITKTGGNMLESILGKDPNEKEGFDYPKPVELIKSLIKIFGKKDSKILDFFAGSGTTGQAVMELNREDGGNRSFVLNTLGDISIDKKKKKNINICREITYERLYRIINGRTQKGSKDFEWINNNEPYNDQNIVYLKTKFVNKINGSFEEIEEEKEVYEKYFSQKLDISKIARNNK